MSYKFLSFESFYQTLESGFINMKFKDVVAFHEETDTFVFVIVFGLVLALISWILSLVTGLHTWVKYILPTKIFNFN